VFESLPEEFKASTRLFREHLGELLPHLPDPLRAHRISQALMFSVHTAADREQAHAKNEGSTLSFAYYVSNLLSGLEGFLSAPVHRSY
jgi:hypothetical protein